MRAYTFAQLRTVAFQMREVADYLHDEDQPKGDKDNVAAAILRESAENIHEFLRLVEPGEHELLPEDTVLTFAKV